MRFKGLDLNLLVVFDALMETRSVTRAAERIGLTQPATSAALRRLRDYFRDEIVVAVGKRMHPTPFAEALHPQIQQALRRVERAISMPTEFDPSTSTRRFRIIGSDYIMVAVLVPLIERFARTAPGVRIEIIQPNEHSVAELEAGRADLLVTPEPFLASWHPSEVLFDEEQVVVGWAQNPIFARGVTADDFYAAGHVTVAFGANRTPAFADSALSRMGRERRVEVTVGSFASAPWFIEGTSRLAVLHERLVRQIARRFNLAWARMPFDFPTMQEMMQFHEARAEDAGLAWLRQQMREVASENA
ncbi:transcriptional regulator, LysR family [Novosphingobium aromaticivorans DSM 12444]|uniref:Transcriptional regulator, LysR family n=1 Tax=Novosphingobium aromaticivorans (strain ATCC 700278 / DSM 12444 / CCUG 56034 / CIP 105152 / NBRC 16084 / F199) TaxID=279238 RepID=Q2G901_NOVAD|nr:LysR family transcriptional regulator [Novosphingobium aromaticivorans]ABD25672.1 transcriptional regulator, LysR family [Novosphingobium aromaticivorans DSM 12444]SCY00164.1 transcriptional regulator, LysR family [Novosphingobium aromaticivorans]